MENAIREKFCDLLLDVGINMREGQNLTIQAEPIHWDFVLELERRAYEKGARCVEPRIVHPKSRINAANARRSEFLGSIPSYHKRMFEAFAEEGWSSISFDGQENLELMREMDQGRNALNVKAQRETSRPYSETLMSGKNSWTISALPTPAWAARVLGRPLCARTTGEFSELLASILKLDTPNPVEAWHKHGQMLHRRCDILNSTALQSLRFEAEGTDLTIALNHDSHWKGGAIQLPDGRFFFPNLPTEEVFTTPDWRKTEGRVQVTRPVEVLGDRVEDAWFLFREGRVVEFGAKAGRHLLERYFEIDPKARFLGEVALVDSGSPIFASGKIFSSILFDENASCHIALGRGITMAMRNTDGKSEDELDAMGCNKSLLHTDFMIGSDTLSVSGVDKAGNSLHLIRAGRFVL
jgi:aminopeptidase